LFELNFRWSYRDYTLCEAVDIETSCDTDPTIATVRRRRCDLQLDRSFVLHREFIQLISLRIIAKFLYFAGHFPAGDDCNKGCEMLEVAHSNE
jgi:hypothetical protein